MVLVVNGDGRVRVSAHTAVPFKTERGKTMLRAKDTVRGLKKAAASGKDKNKAKDEAGHCCTSLLLLFFLEGRRFHAHFYKSYLYAEAGC